MKDKFCHNCSNLWIVIYRDKALCKDCFDFAYRQNQHEEAESKYDVLIKAFIELMPGISHSDLALSIQGKFGNRYNKEIFISNLQTLVETGEIKLMTHTWLKSFVRYFPKGTTFSFEKAS